MLLATANIVGHSPSANFLGTLMVVVMTLHPEGSMRFMGESSKSAVRIPEPSCKSKSAIIVRPPSEYWLGATFVVLVTVNVGGGILNADLAAAGMPETIRPGLGRTDTR